VDNPENVVTTQPSLSKAAECLNTAFAADPNAIHALLVNRVPCNQSLAEHPHVVVDNPPVIDGQHFSVGALGLVNGVLTANGLPRIGAKFEPMPSDQEGRFKIVGFADFIQKHVECSICFDPDGTQSDIVDVIGRCDTCRDKELQAESEKLGKSVAASQAEATARAITEASSKSRGVPSIAELWEIYSHLQLLRSEEASEVTFTASNPDDSNGFPLEVVEIRDLWTEWVAVDFRGATLLECLRKAVETRKAWYADKEAKRAKLSQKT